MSKHNEIGKLGEQIAIAFLQQKGYHILDLNWRYNRKEIDIVARDHQTMVFVEVKTRSNLLFELPAEAVTITKQRNIVACADDYLNLKNIELQSRFDIVTVIAEPKPKILEHIEDAFRPNELI